MISEAGRGSGRYGEVVMRVEPSRQRYDPLGWQRDEHMDWRQSAR